MKVWRLLQSEEGNHDKINYFREDHPPSSSRILELVEEYADCDDGSMSKRSAEITKSLCSSGSWDCRSGYAYAELKLIDLVIE